MNIKAQTVVLGLIGIVLVTLYTPITLGYTHLGALYTGTIQFPLGIKKTPSVRIYFTGNKILSTVCSESKKTTFTISSHNCHKPLYIVVTEDVQWDSDENTIKNLKTNPHNPYKFYCIAPKTKKETDMPCAGWNIQEVSLDNHGTIPDNTIVIVLNPEWVESFKGGDSITLPTIYIRSNIVTMVSGEDNLHAITEALLLNAIDSDSIHKKRMCIVKPQYHIKTVLALTT